MKLEIRVLRYPGPAIASLRSRQVGTRRAIPVGMKKTQDGQAALLAFLNHTVESARKEQIAFGEAATKDVESALQWRAEGALVAVFTERHAKTALEQVKLGRELLPIYENLIDRLTMLASGHNASAEIRALATLARSLKDWVA